MALADYLVPVQGKKSNICFDCQKACGGCSWTEVDEKTGRQRFEPVPGWTARPVLLNLGMGWNGERNMAETYHITACPEFLPDEQRRTDNCELSHTENKYFMENINQILRRWNNDD